MQTINGISTGEGVERDLAITLRSDGELVLQPRTPEGTPYADIAVRLGDFLQALGRELESQRAITVGSL